MAYKHGHHRNGRQAELAWTPPTEYLAEQAQRLEELEAAWQQHEAEETIMFRWSTERTEVEGPHSLPTGRICYDYEDPTRPELGFGCVTYNPYRKSYRAEFFGQKTTRRTKGNSLVAAQQWVEHQAASREESN